ncbi:hypothetical protein EDB87DRAFT_1580254 [Lactarius vividus]|nr:hypothetical protein EDB87DRAFT_1580254 [Lactarius vividus]
MPPITPQEVRTLSWQASVAVVAIVIETRVIKIDVINVICEAVAVQYGMAARCCTATRSENESTTCTVPYNTSDSALEDLGQLLEPVRTCLSELIDAPSRGSWEPWWLRLNIPGPCMHAYSSGWDRLELLGEFHHGCAHDAAQSGSVAEVLIQRQALLRVVLHEWLCWGRLWPKRAFRAAQGGRQQRNESGEFHQPAVVEVQVWQPRQAKCILKENELVIGCSLRWDMFW